MTSALPVRCSTNWAIKPHIGSEVNLLSSCLSRETWTSTTAVQNMNYFIYYTLLFSTVSVISCWKGKYSRSRYILSKGCYLEWPVEIWLKFGYNHFGTEPFHDKIINAKTMNRIREYNIMGSWNYLVKHMAEKTLKQWQSKYDRLKHWVS